MEQPPRFESGTFPHHVFKLNKALYELKHALRALYGNLRSFLIENGFEIEKVDTTAFCKNYDPQLILVQV